MSILNWAVVAAEGDPARAEWKRAAQEVEVAAPRFVTWDAVLSSEAEFHAGETVFFERMSGWDAPNPVGGQGERYREFGTALAELGAAVDKSGAVLAAAVEPTLLTLDRTRLDGFLRENRFPVLGPGDLESAGGNILRSRFAASDDWIIDGWHTNLYPHRTRSGFEVWRAPAESSAGRREIQEIVGLLGADAVHAVADLHRVHLNSDFYDLRFAVVAGTVTHAAGVVRERIVHKEFYGGRRVELDKFLERFGAARWQKVVGLAERTAGLFPGIRSLGVDVILDNSDSEYVFDVNPFGAYLPGLLETRDAELVVTGENVSVKAAVLRSLSASD